MNSTAKGNSLEDALVDYLIDQQVRGHLVYDVYQPELCKIRKKAKYPCPDRRKPVEFDIVIEVYRRGGKAPHLYAVFECKNYKSGIPEDRVRVFSDQISSVFGHSAKGILVVSSRLQSGAEAIARSRSMGIVKFSEAGADVVVDRRIGSALENNYVKSQIFGSEYRTKPLKFSAYFEGQFFSNIGEMLERIDQGSTKRMIEPASKISVPYLPLEDITAFAAEIIEATGYEKGHVDLKKVCAAMSLKLEYTRQNSFDEDGSLILGSANFDRNVIKINSHNNEFRERFTIAHEIGHFCLGHGNYLRSETVVESDLLMDMEGAETFNFSRLELQANLFASEIILPDKIFRTAVMVACKTLEMRDIGFGLIYVDDKPWNYQPYNQLISYLSEYFLASRQATEIRLKKLGLVNDQRRFGFTESGFSFGEVLSRIHPYDDA